MHENVTEKAIWDDQLIFKKTVFFFFEKSYASGNVSCGGHDNPEVFSSLQQA